MICLDENYLTSLEKINIITIRAVDRNLNLKILSPERVGFIKKLGKQLVLHISQKINHFVGKEIFLNLKDNLNNLNEYLGPVQKIKLIKNGHDKRIYRILKNNYSKI